MARTIAGRVQIWTSVYRVGSALVDSGCSSARPVFAKLLGERAVTDVLTTHEHEDHIGNHELLPPGVRVHAPALAVAFLREGAPSFPRYRRFFWGTHGTRGGALVVGEKLNAADRSWRVVQTNGHSSDHVAYFEEAEQWLFSGDAYMGKFRAARDAEDLHEEIASLRRMAELDASMLFPAHGPIIERPRKRLLDVAQHYEDLARKCQALREKGWSDRRISREVNGREGWITIISSGEFSGPKLVRNLLRRQPG